MSFPAIVDREEWLQQRKALLAAEKEFTRARDALNARRRRLPVTRLEKDYRFETPNGRVRLLDLFEGRRQLIIYHFMFDPADPPPGRAEPFSEGCSGCSHFADSIPHLSHLHARDTSFVVVSRAPPTKIQPFKARMGWTFPWVSSFGSDFNYDFHVTTDEKVAPVEYNYRSQVELAKRGHDFHLAGEQPGLSVFLRDDGNSVFHAYSTYGRGLDMFLTVYHLLDHTPLGRQEDWEDSPPGWPQTSMFWMKHHDRYDNAAPAVPSPCCSERTQP